MTGGGRIAANLAAVHARIDAAAIAAGRDPGEVALVAVSKNHPAEAVRAAYAEGQRDFGENRVQELATKAVALVDLAGLRWHMIGSLQTNKVRDLLHVPGLALVHSLDRQRLADALQTELAAAARTLPVLLQVHATDEVSKHGCALDEAAALLRYVSASCPALRVEGVMAMGPANAASTPAFDRAITLREMLRTATGLPLAVASLGMSGDLEAAIGSGATIVRVGTDVFGVRA